VEYGLLDKEDNLTESGQVFFSGLLPLLRHNIKLLQNPDRQKKVLDVISRVLRKNGESKGKPHKDLTRLNLDPDKPLGLVFFSQLFGELNSRYLHPNNLPQLERRYDTDGNLLERAYDSNGNLLAGYKHNEKFDFSDLPTPNSIIQNVLIASRVSMAGFDFYSLIENLSTEGIW